MKQLAKCDVIVAGGGHAGIEAALATARIGFNTLLVTLSKKAIGRMSCNPAIGGTAKGHLVKEIDALGGEMAKTADKTGIHYRMLNMSKGPAVWSPRCQNDREWYSAESIKVIENQANLSILEDSIVDILTASDGDNSSYRLRGAITRSGREIECKGLILCAGTFLRGLMHTGLDNQPGGRYGESAVTGLTENLEKLGFIIGRLKTGTPPRIDLNSIDFSEVEFQGGDEQMDPLSLHTDRILNPQIPMMITCTNRRTHEVLKKGFDKSPLFTGRIKGVGPRYCPSIEDKIVRFSERERHLIFLEPEGYNTHIVYVNGFSTSLPSDIQIEGLRTIRGLKNVRMLRHGYAIEYDFFPPHQLRATLETRLVSGLYFAGQINGTSGYEEAAAQGLIAGINAARKLQGKDHFILKRSQGYIGVLIDDLVSKGTEEPYRMFTSRAEYRLLLRQDNADLRLMDYGYENGLIPKNIYDRFNRKRKYITRGISSLKKTSIQPSEVNEYLISKQTNEITQSAKMYQLLQRPEVTLKDFSSLPTVRGSKYFEELNRDVDEKLRREILTQIEIEIKYKGYIARQLEDVKRFERQESIGIPEGFDYSKITSLSREAREKLSKFKPVSFGQASRISGVTGADISVLMVYLKQ